MAGSSSKARVPRWWLIREGATRTLQTFATRRSSDLKSFGGLPAISDVSLAVAQGERRLIIGPNGAGKTTSINLIIGGMTSRGGTSDLLRQEVSRLATHRRVHLGLARTYQIITLCAQD